MKTIGKLLASLWAVMGFFWITNLSGELMSTTFPLAVPIGMSIILLTLVALGWCLDKMWGLYTAVSAVVQFIKEF